MRKSAPIEVVVHYPKTKEGWDELGKRVATAHANYVIEKIDRLNCPTWQKLLFVLHKSFEIRLTQQNC